MSVRSIFACLGMFCLCGFLLFIVSRDQNHDLTQIVKDFPGLNQRTAREKPERAPQKNLVPPNSSNVDTSYTTQGEIDTTEEDRLMEQFLEIEESSEYQNFVNTKTQEWVEAYKQTGIFNASFQDFLDFYESQGMPRIDFAEGALEAFREYFPEGGPEDYEAEMVARFQEAFWSTSGSRTYAMTDALSTLYEEPDFSAWMLGRFKGKIGLQLQWAETQAVTAMEILKDTPVKSDFILPAPVSLPTEDASDMSSTPSETIPPPASQGVSQSNIDPTTSVETQGFSPERIASVQQVLQEYGTDVGLLRLIETDPEGVNWLFENFRSMDEIDAWMSPPEGPLQGIEKSNLTPRQF